MSTKSPKSSSVHESASLPTDPTAVLHHLRKSLDPAEKGKRDGQQGLPRPGDTDLGTHESEITQAVGQVRNRIVKKLHGDLRSIDEQLKVGNLDSRIDDLRDTLAKLRTNLTTIREDLVSTVARLDQECSEWHGAVVRFREEHGLRRPAMVPTPGHKVLTFGVLAVLFLVETVINASLLARVDSGGFLGGFTIAMGISAVNLAGPVLLANTWLRFVVHRKRGMKWAGIGGWLFYLLLFLPFNLAVAHYREAPSSGEAISRMFSDPFALPDFGSWLLFVIGFAFSAGAVLDGWKMNDPYPGYGKQQEQANQHKASFDNGKRAAIEELAERQGEFRDEVAPKRRGVRVAIKEHNGLLSRRSELEAACREDLKELEKSANVLLKEYREGNQARRQSAVPGYFRDPWKIDRDAGSQPSQFDPIPDDEGERRVAKVLEECKDAQDALESKFDEVRKVLDGYSGTARKAQEG